MSDTQTQLLKAWLMRKLIHVKMKRFKVSRRRAPSSIIVLYHCSNAILKPTCLMRMTARISLSVTIILCSVRPCHAAKAAKSTLLRNLAVHLKIASLFLNI